MKSKELQNYLLLILGSLILAFGLVSFFQPNGLITGGTAGLALLLYYITDFSIGTWMVAINIPLLLIGIKYLGKMFAIRTIATIFFISTFADVLHKFLHVKPFVLDTTLGAIFGGIVVGIGLALVIKANSSAGGSTIVAKIIASKGILKPGQVILVIDSIIVLCALFIFEDNIKILWSVLSIYVTGKIIDTILTGRLNKKAVYVVTQKTEELRVQIRESLGKYGTILSGEGLYQGEEKRMILVVVEVNKLQLLKELVKQNDPDGFLLITEVSEILGRGQ